MSFNPADMPEDMTLEDWIPVFEPMEQNDALRPHANVSLPEYIEKLQNGEIDHDGVGYEKGSNTSIFYNSDTTASIVTDWGPRQIVENDSMAEGFLSYHGTFQGDVVDEVKERVADQHSAPYFEINETDYEDGEIGIEFSLPDGYNQEQWEETVDTMVDVLNELDQYQDELEAVSDRYPE